MDQQPSMPREAMIGIMSDVVLYGTAVTMTVMTINESGRPSSTWARISPSCLVVTGGVPDIAHQPGCGCAALQPVIV